MTGAVEVYANHAVLILGSTGWPELDWDDSPASADGRHVAIQTRGQIGHIRVSFWSGTMPLPGEIVFDGDLDLDDARICVGDIEGLRRWTQRVGRTGSQRVIVQVDDPGHASRIHVGLDLSPDARVLPLPSTGGPALFSVLTSEHDGMALPNERGLALDGHDSPHSRLAAAISLLSSPDPAKPWQDKYEATLIAEWLRWLSISLSYPEAEGLGEQLRRLVHAARSAESGRGGGIAHEDAGDIARTILDAVTRGAPERP
ncbi:hypothetical protein [Dactylosporangium sp. NPDC048998]|uniref:hypothetical protein n=1 Tax=Dactylosporangium sp. NPDC048998 TaxID=3363976 RepID=UPI003714097B